MRRRSGRLKYSAHMVAISSRSAGVILDDGDAHVPSLLCRDCADDVPALLPSVPGEGNTGCRGACVSCQKSTFRAIRRISTTKKTRSIRNGSFSRYALITWRNAVSLGQSLVHDLGGLGEHLVQSLGGFEALGVHLVDVLGAGRTGGEPVVLGGDLQTADLGVVARSLGELGGDVLAGQLGGRRRRRR